MRRPGTYPALLVVTNVIYAIPSIALFVVLGPWLGFTNDKPIIMAMALYTLVILVRNIVEAVRSVPDAVVRAADGMGYRPLRRFVAVELPLAVPGIVAGLRLATVSTVSLISVGALIGRGGLGRLFSDGRARGIVVELWAGLIAVVVLALVLDALLVLAGRLATPWRRAGRAARHEDDRRRLRLADDRRQLVGSQWHRRGRAASTCGTRCWRCSARRRSGCRSGWRSGTPVVVASSPPTSPGLWRAIPTVGVVGLLFTWRPLTLWPVLVALIILAVPPIVLNTAAGHRQHPRRRARRGARGWA